MSETGPVDIDKQWRLRKEISVPTLAFLAIQALIIVWSASAIYSDIGKTMDAQTRRLERLEKIDAESRLVRLEERADATGAALRRIEEKLDRLVERREK